MPLRKVEEMSDHELIEARDQAGGFLGPLIEAELQKRARLRKHEGPQARPSVRQLDTSAMQGHATSVPFDVPTEHDIRAAEAGDPEARAKVARFASSHRGQVSEIGTGAHSPAVKAAQERRNALDFLKAYCTREFAR